MALRPKTETPHAMADSLRVSESYTNVRIVSDNMDDVQKWALDSARQAWKPLSPPWSRRRVRPPFPWFACYG